MTITFREFNFKDGDPYAGGPCILEDGPVVWAAVSDERDGTDGTIIGAQKTAVNGAHWGRRRAALQDSVFAAATEHLG